MCMCMRIWQLSIFEVHKHCTAYVYGCSPTKQRLAHALLHKSIQLDGCILENSVDAQSEPVWDDKGHYRQRYCALHAFGSAADEPG